MYESLLFQTYPGFLSLRNSKQQIVFLNQNFRDWIGKYTGVDPIGKTNVELAALVPENVAATFLQCHDASLDLQSDTQNQTGLKKIIEFKGANPVTEVSQYFDTLKYKVMFQGEPHIFTIAYDVTELYLESQDNLKSAMTDVLTGAKNRRYLLENIQLFYGHVAVALDLDNFKTINDREGHNRGDRILREFVEFLTAQVKDIAAAIRLGGDEFLLVFSNGCDGQALEQTFQRTRVVYEQIYFNYPYLSFSFGIHRISHDINATLAELDKKLYLDKARAQGRDCDPQYGDRQPVCSEG